MEVAVADREKPSDLEERRRVLDAALAARKPKGSGEGGGAEKGGVGEFGKALRLSSEFIAGIVVGAALGWFIDRMAGTSPWGLIVFLLLGFGAGILNVLRSAGLIAEFGSQPSKDDDDLQGR
jgi:ATP synthase protein I